MNLTKLSLREGLLEITTSGPLLLMNKNVQTMFRTEIADFSAEFRDVFINKVREIDTMADFMWDWSSTPVLPKVFKFKVVM